IEPQVNMIKRIEQRMKVLIQQPFTVIFTVQMKKCTRGTYMFPPTIRILLRLCARHGGVFVSSMRRHRPQAYLQRVDIRETVPPAFSLSALLVGGTCGINGRTR